MGSRQARLYVGERRSVAAVETGDYDSVAMPAPPKTNAARRLEALSITYELRSFEVGDEHLSAGEYARRLGVPENQVFKTLLVTGDRTGPCFAVVGADAELDFKALAKLSGNKSVEMVPLSRLTAITGYIRGGTTALAAKKDLPVFLDSAAMAEPHIAVSAGVRGVQLVLAPADYVRATRATAGPFSRPPVPRS
jgi:Cys-tRNA(Pro)/Cys-tRNA(Cys) deacylase